MLEPLLAFGYGLRTYVLRPRCETETSLQQVKANVLRVPIVNQAWGPLVRNTEIRNYPFSWTKPPAFSLACCHCLIFYPIIK